MNFSAVILAGGQSKRMGQDKAWLMVQGKPLIARQIELVRELGAAEVFISGRAGTDYGSLGCLILKDRFEDSGPLAGIESALTAISTPWLLVLAVDMPRMQAAQLQLLVARCTENCGGIARVEGGIEPLVAIYPRAALKVVREVLESGRKAATHFAERCVGSGLATFVEFSPAEAGYFENWNTPADVSNPELASRVYARPHPSPLPRGEGETLDGARNH